MKKLGHHSIKHLRTPAPLVRFWLSLVLVLGILLLSGCAQSTHTSRMSQDWSRGLLLDAASTSDRPAIVLSSAGERLLLAWIIRPEPGQPEALQIMALDTASGQVIDRWVIPAPAGFPTDLELVAAEEAEQVHLFWLDGPYRQRALFHLLLEPTGEPVGEPTRLSPTGQQVLSAHSAPLPNGSLMILWTTWSGLSLLQMDSQGRFSGPPLLQPDVLSAGMAVDSQGLVHLAWIEPISNMRLNVRYAITPPDSLSMLDSRIVTSILLTRDQTQQDIGGPLVATDESFSYVIWARTTQTLLGTTEGIHYVAIGDGGIQEPQTLSFPREFPPVYTSTQQVAGLSYLAVPFQSKTRGASVYRVPQIISGRQEQCLLALSLQCETRNQSELQPTLAVIDGGQVLGYSVAGWTNRPSVGVSAVANGQGDLYLAWVDSIGQLDEYPVYLTTTSAELERIFNRLTVADVLAGLRENSIRFLQGLTFFPLALLWIVLPMGWLFVALWWHHGDLGIRASRLAMAVAAILHLGSKYLLTADLLVLIPHLAFVPTDMATALIYGLPLATGAVGLLLTYLLYIRPQGRDWTPVPAYLIFAACDMFITLGIHGIAHYE